MAVELVGAVAVEGDAAVAAKEVVDLGRVDLVVAQILLGGGLKQLEVGRGGDRDARPAGLEADGAVAAGGEGRGGEGEGDLVADFAAVAAADELDLGHGSGENWGVRAMIIEVQRRGMGKGTRMDAEDKNPRGITKDTDVGQATYDLNAAVTRAFYG